MCYQLITKLNDKLCLTNSYINLNRRFIEIVNYFTEINFKISFCNNHQTKRNIRARLVVLKVRNTKNKVLLFL